MRNNEDHEAVQHERVSMATSRLMGTSTTFRPSKPNHT